MLKKILKTTILVIFSFICINHVFALPVITNDAPKIDENKDTSLTIELVDVEDNKLSNATFSVYKVASMNDTGIFNTEEKFIASQVSYEYETQEEWDEVLKELLAYIEDNNISYDFTLTTNSNGIATKNNIEKGLYLIYFDSYIVGARTYNPQSILISIPNMTIQNEWEYEVKTYPKCAYDIDLNKIADKKVIKVWNDKGKEKYRPQYITVQLYKDSELYDEVKLDSSNGWSYQWNNLDNTYKWEVKEIGVSNKYSVDINYENNIFTITNTYDDKLPNTGLLWWPVPILFGTGLILLVIGIIIKRKQDTCEK